MDKDIPRKINKITDQYYPYEYNHKSLLTITKQTEPNNIQKGWYTMTKYAYKVGLAYKYQSIQHSTVTE